MLKEASSGFSKFFTKQRVVILVIFLLLAFVLTSYASGKTELDMNMLKNEGYQNAVPPEAFEGDVDAEAVAEAAEAAPEESEEGFSNMNVNAPSDLLPTNSGDSSLVNSMMTQDGQMPGNLLESGAHIGLPTTSSSMRNANLQLRSEPPNPQVKVSPWLQSTIEPDTNRKPMEIGGCE